MQSLEPEVLVVGGGPTGASVAARLAAAGLAVTLLEQRVASVDLGMGEAIYPWGGRYLNQLGLLPALQAAGLRELTNLATYYQGVHAETAPWADQFGQRYPSYGIYYPDLREALLRFAVSAGVHMLCPARAISSGEDGAGRGYVLVRHKGRELVFHPALVIVADGRRSVGHRWLGSRIIPGHSWRHILNVRVAGLQVGENELHVAYGPGTRALVIPYGRGMGRIYLICSAAEAAKCKRPAGFAHLVSTVSDCLPPGALGNVREMGRVFCVPGRNMLVLPGRCRQTIVLAGDAAGSTDPCMAMGLSLCFRDSLTLAELILKGGFDQMAMSFARARAAYFSIHLRHVEWSMRLWFEDSAAAETLRREVLLSRSDDPDAGGWERIYVDGADPLLRKQNVAEAFFGHAVPEWAIAG
jgi:2-polyprenyl-6-methoxyphenol hydroxylase-like FAD-dependent oxidoreductase